jgi:hypothetical protein
MARPKIQPTDEQRRLVKSLSACGVLQEQIARRLGIRSVQTLRRHFREELDRGTLDANTTVAQSTTSAARKMKRRPVNVSTLRDNEYDCIARRRCANRISCQACIQPGPLTIADSSVVTAPSFGLRAKKGAHRSRIRPPSMESPSMKMARSSGPRPKRLMARSARAPSQLACLVGSASR